MAAEPAQSQRSVHVIISGRVQGVSYRAWLQSEAVARGIRGWTRNRKNGDVEAVFSGTPESVQSLCEICWSGPPMAQVNQVLVEDAGSEALEPLGAAQAFAILPTL